ncbi:chaperonin GroEL [bacterium]|nr:chaperonin GroEL [bacterium]
MSKIILYGSEASNRITSGSEKLAKAVGVTMGPKGKCVILGKFVGAPVITKDGVSVAREVVLQDPVEDLVCQLVKEAAGRTADVAGDGTTTATVLSDEILRRGYALLSEGYSNIYFRNGVRWAIDNICKNLDSISRKIETNDDLRNIATISANNDSHLGEKIAEAFSYAGLTGTVGAEANPSGETSVRKVSGVNLKTGYITPEFIVDKSSKDIVLKNCRILLVNREMTHFSDCIKLFEEAHQSNSPVLIVAKDVKQEALATLVANTKLGKLKSVAVKIPSKFYSGDWMEDLSIMLNSRIVDESKGVYLSKTGIEDLGFAEKVIVNRYETKIFKAKCNEGAKRERIDAYQRDLESLIGDKTKLDIKDRLSFLTGSAAIISVGYSTELELRETGDRLDDALSATKAAIEQGLVPGGGVALLRACKMLDLMTAPKECLDAINVIIEACKRPAKQIILNAGLDSDKIVGNILQNQEDKYYGFNSLTEEYGNMMEMGVVDPLKVTKTALRNASSIAELLINTEAILAEKPDDPSEWQPPAGWRPPQKGNLNHNY